MSALGQKQTYAPQQAMSALPPIATAKADMKAGAPPGKATRPPLVGSQDPAPTKPRLAPVNGKREGANSGRRQHSVGVLREGLHRSEPRSIPSLAARRHVGDAGWQSEQLAD